MCCYADFLACTVSRDTMLSYTVALSLHHRVRQDLIRSSPEMRRVTSGAKVRPPDPTECDPDTGGGRGSRSSGGVSRHAAPSPQAQSGLPQMTSLLCAPGERIDEVRRSLWAKAAPQRSPSNPPPPLESPRARAVSALEVDLKKPRIQHRVAFHRLAFPP